MTLIKILIISFSLAVDVFAISLCKGLSSSNFSWRRCLVSGIYFGLFQSLMPIFGFLLGSSVRNLLYFIGHYVVFFFFMVIGTSMIYDAFCGDNKGYDNDFSFWALILAALLTSIDAFSVGITFAFLKVDLLADIIIIGLVSYVMAILGMYIGNRFGRDDSKKAKIAGGLILILMAIELLIEHLL